MEKLFVERLVLRDRSSFTETRENGLVLVRLRGGLECTYNLIVSVRKRLDVRRGRHNRYEVRTTDYSYHGWIGGTKQHVIRYDNAHEQRRLHCHRFDVNTGAEYRVDFYEIQEFPTLDEVIREAVELARAIAEVRR